jgi:hypothetical protein
MEINSKMENQPLASKNFACLHTCNHSLQKLDGIQNHAKSTLYASGEFSKNPSKNI